MTRRVLLLLMLAALATASPGAQRGGGAAQPQQPLAGPAAIITIDKLELATDYLQWERWYAPPEIQLSATVQINILKAALSAEGTTDDAIKLRAYAVRALGRLQNPNDLPTLSQMLADPAPLVRQYAAAAIAHSLWNATDRARADVTFARLRLEARLTQEADGAAKTAVLEALGSLPYGAQENVGHIVTLLSAGGAMGLPGLEVLTRRRAGITLDLPTVTLLRQLAAANFGRTQERDIRALRILQNIRDDDASTIKAAAMWNCNGASGPECGVDFRVIGVQMMTALDKRYADEFDHALHDPAWQVRYEALTKAAQMIATTGTCAPLIDALDDRVNLIVRHAVELFSPACAEREDLTARLLSWAGKLGDSLNDAEWHVPAAALETLLKFDPAEAHRIAKDAAATHQVWQVRVIAARIAGTLYDEDLALNLSSHDPGAPQGLIEANVRVAALKALRKMSSKQVPAAAIDALTDPDDELVFTAASLLKDSGDHEAVQPLLDALSRLSTKLGSTRSARTGNETSTPTPLQLATLEGARDSSRDARVAILAALQNLADSSDGLPSLLRDLLIDTDPIVASTAADVIARFVAKRPVPKPTKYAPIQPSGAEIIKSSRCARMVLDDGTQIDMTMDMANAPIASARFLTLASGKFYDGLTFHRVEPNNFVQAGSPDANELSNGDRFIRDEIAAPLLANRVAFVSRGPDTAAGQFFISQVDLPAFDHVFTVFAKLAGSLSQLLQEGKIIEGARIATVREVACQAK